MIDEDEPTPPRTGSAFEAEREALRARLAFPDSIESASSTGRREKAAKRLEEEPPHPVPDEVIAAVIEHPSSEEVSHRLDQLAMRVSALVGLVESVFDRLDASSAGVTPLTAEELADMSARMVRLIETRLETHSERLEQVIAELSTRGTTVAAVETTSQLALVEDHLSVIGRAIHDLQRSMAELEQLPAPEHVVSEVAGTVDLSELQRVLTELPERLALEQPVARLDTAILQQVEARFEEMSTQIAQKTEDLLASRVQRFEALSQGMMTLVGEPIDALTEKLSQLAKQREVALNVDKRLRAMEDKLDRLSQGQGTIF